MARGPVSGMTAAVGPRAGSRGRPDAWRNSARNHGNPFVLADDEDSGQQSVTITRDPKDQEVKGIPVGLFVAVGGELQFEPLKGFEHLVSPQVGDKLSREASTSAPTQCPTVPSTPEAAPANTLTGAAATDTQRIATTTASQSKLQASRARVPPTIIEKALAPATSLPLQPKPPTHHKRPTKRTRAVAHSQQGDVPVVQNVSTFTFNIADVEALRQFYEVRLNEFTLKPIRKILTEWVSFAAPKRRRFYGKYKKKTLPRDLVDGSAPPWWPDDVYYEEPSHLESRELKKLGAGILLLHRFTNSETDKPRNNWVRELRRIAEHIVHMTPVEEFTSSNMKEGSNYNADMKARALNDIIPDLFDTAQSYEDHVAQYDLYDGRTNGNPNSLHGKQHTWAPIRRPERSIASKSGRSENKRARLNERESRSADTADSMETDEVVIQPSKSLEPLSTSSASQQMVQAPEENTSMRRGSEPASRRNRKPFSVSQPPPSDQRAPLSIAPPTGMPPQQSQFVPQTSFSNLSLSPATPINGLPYNPYHDMQMTTSMPLAQNYVGAPEIFNYPNQQQRWPTMQYLPPSNPGFSNPQMPPYFSSMPGQEITPDYAPNIQAQQDSYQNFPTQHFYMPTYDEKVPMHNIDMTTPSTPIMDCKMSFGSNMSFDSTNSADDLMMPATGHHLAYTNTQTHHHDQRN